MAVSGVALDAIVPGPPVGKVPLIGCEHERGAVEAELVSEVESLSVEVAQHVLFDTWEHFDEGLSLDLGAINNPCDDGAEGPLIELGFFLEERGELIGPVVVVDCLLGFSPLCKHVEHVLVVLVVCDGEVSDVSISLIVVEVKFPFWLNNSEVVASSAGTAVNGCCEASMVVRATVASL